MNNVAVLMCKICCEHFVCHDVCLQELGMLPVTQRRLINYAECQVLQWAEYL